MVIKHPEFSNLHVSDHPLIAHNLASLRHKDTGKADFKRLLKDISTLLTYELLADWDTVPAEIETPLTKTQCPVLACPSPVIIPILRAGLGMSEYVEELLPQSTMGHIGLYRDEETNMPVEYLVKLPDLNGRKIILTDPMIATGHSSEVAIELIVKHGARPKDIVLMGLIAAPEGIKVLEDSYPDVAVYVAALDSHLNEKAYIVPGLGDAGDRLFGTL